MFNTKLKDIQIVDYVKPIVYLNDLSGIKLIVVLPNNEYAFLLPPYYEINKIVSRDDVASAIAKHFYKPIVGEQILRSKEELITFLKWFNNKSNNNTGFA